MRVEPAQLATLSSFIPKPFHDNRGFFMRTFDVYILAAGRSTRTERRFGSIYIAIHRLLPKAGVRSLVSPLGCNALELSSVFRGYRSNCAATSP